ncbi:thioredoxin-2-like [Condylostylus longicornis]|uniref:thioredoxin-2-like n=1 Tax=Condylostylus longicornis TaxID=2530218 RepID=UPI00244E19DA|nr:thioredoxin-2-like [Condylostylus longicornis]
MAIHVKNSQELKETLDKTTNKLVVLDFFANWCGPCKTLAPKIEEYAKQFESNILIIKIDVDDLEEIAMEYEISSMPTLIFIKSGEELERFSGSSTDTLEKLINQHVETQNKAVEQT